MRRDNKELAVSVPLPFKDMVRRHFNKPEREPSPEINPVVS